MKYSNSNKTVEANDIFESHEGSRFKVLSIDKKNIYNSLIFYLETLKAICLISKRRNININDIVVFKEYERITLIKKAKKEQIDMFVEV